MHVLVILAALAVVAAIVAVAAHSNRPAPVAATGATSGGDTPRQPVAQ